MEGPVLAPATGPAPPPAVVVGEIGGEILRARLAAVDDRPLTVKEQRFAELYVAYGSKTRAYREAYDVKSLKNHSDWNDAQDVLERPRVWRYVQELQSAAAATCKVDLQALIASDLAIVRAAEFATSLTQHVWHSCRYCHGVGHQYQWIDANEYAAALVAWMDASALAEARKIELPAEPTDAGGYGFDPKTEPNVQCPKCEGIGVQRTIFADTRNLGKAAPLFLSVEETKNGIKYHTHDVAKAKDRLYRATGAYGDDAASVARGAAAGAAAGVAAAQAIVAKVDDMTEDELRKGYLTLVQP